LTVAGLLLTGGASRRLGRPKAEVPIGATTLSRRAARVLAEVCEPVVEVGPGVSGLPAVREDPPGTGPLAALVAGADRLTALVAGADRPAASGSPPAAAAPQEAGIVVFACDLPFVDAPLLALIAAHPSDLTVIPRDRNGRLQYTCARYAAEAVEAARAMLARGRSSLRELAGSIAVEILEPPAWAEVAVPHAFDDLDTPDDFARHGIALPGGPPGRRAGPV